MKRLAAISPHLDDAAFSAGGTLAAHVSDGWAVTVVTCFTGNVARPSGFALACQLDKGLGPEVDYMALRRAEDRAACAALGAQAVHLPLLEAPHRGYASAAALFGPRLPGDQIGEALTPMLGGVLRALGPDLVLGPMAIGNHVDHHLVRDALAAVAPADTLLWEDWPYLDRAERPADPVRTVALDRALVETRIAACAAYESQLGFQFGSREAMVARLEAIGEERFHALG